MSAQSLFCEMMGIQLPLIQAPMAGGPTTPELIVAVANAGGLGSLGAAYLSPEQLQQNIRAIKDKTEQPFAVNLFVPHQLSPVSKASQQAMCEHLNQICQPLGINLDPIEPPYAPNFDEQLEIILAEKVGIFSCIFGVPDASYLNALKQNHCKLIGTATSLAEAEQLAAAGFDAIIAQGIEAGGHRGCFLPYPKDDENLSTLQLVSVLTKHVSLPIIAAGGIATKQHILAAFQHKAAACQLGTAFLTTKESGANPLHKQALLEQQQDNTVLTRGFSGRRARALKNTFTSQIEPHQQDLLPFPAQNKLTKAMRTAAAEQHNPAFMSLWAGTSAAYCQSWDVKKLVDELFK